MKTLSEKLKQWRCERPDEWKMDEFIRYAEELEQENRILKECISQINKIAACPPKDKAILNEVYKLKGGAE